MPWLPLVEFDNLLVTLELVTESMTSTLPLPEEAGDVEDEDEDEDAEEADDDGPLPCPLVVDVTDTLEVVDRLLFIYFFCRAREFWNQT